MTRTVLVTGANGFVGRALCRHLSQHGWQVRRAMRNADGPGTVGVGAIGPDTDWRVALLGCDAVVHLAGRVHMMKEVLDDPASAYFRVNTAATLALGHQAASAGVRRFVFVSTVKVNGESSTSSPFEGVTVPFPQDHYAVSKYVAEQGLLELGRAGQLDPVVVRPALVYGPEVGANFLRLVRSVAAGWPLPFGSIDNRRSLVALDNLVDLLCVCLEHPAAPQQVFMAADGEDFSTGELVEIIAAAAGRPARLLRIRPTWLQAAAALIGKRAAATRLLGSLIVSIEANRRLLGWTPPVPARTALAATVKSIIGEKGT